MFLGGRIAELKMQVKHQKATNHDKVKANLVLQDVIQGNKDINGVPLELLANIKKLLERRTWRKLPTQSTTTSSCVSYVFYYFNLIFAYIWILHACGSQTLAHLICELHLHSYIR
jgi:hypothetical protein